MRIAILLLILTTFISTNSWSKTYKPADFAKGSELYNVKVSPGGEYLTIGLIQEGKRSISIVDAKTFEPVGGARFAYPKQVGPFYWANDERIDVKLLEARAWESEPLFYGELYSINYNSSRGELIYGYSIEPQKSGTRIKPKKQSTRGWADIAYMLPADEENILITSQRWSKDGKLLPELQKLNIYSGRSKGVTRSPTPSGEFVVDSKGEPLFVTGIDEKSKRTFYQYDKKSESWSPMTDIARGKAFWPLTLDNIDENLFYLNTGESGIEGIYRYNLESGQSKHVYTDDAVNITGLQFNSDRTAVYALRTDNG